MALRSGLLAAIAVSWSAVSLGQTPDDVGVRSAIAAQEAALNAHDATALAQAYTDDADVVIPFGWRWRGRAEIERKYADAFTYVLAQSRLHAETIEVTPLAPGLALAHIGWSGSGMRAPDGSPGESTVRSIESQILKDVGGRWLIVSSQETVTTPEQPMAVKAKPAPPVKKCLLANRAGTCLISK